ncbi:hypothetical protein LTR91_004679 [Friedmanniomyces endolithicus]|uniref:Integral membrane protein n=1 Tax=Friedmanniomyces endolithicus TaxID=329885 RepID=A0AAN6KV38_9PEZI|nr:hypothetical protein LTR35_016613 [Friedmanniomyces endolithicus]KAK0273607.1 hypothetical protein LTS00_015730 [Friedmanniomyces endolithicus]KAK0305938.1 hypothetical protein LTR82_016580 [Friedmanniomyces endolithicus]KAK0920535.1 hypothetical protein LTR57_009584 [Friedmanniomyces endolithicus]KAK0977630.1 hypothetical protein LTR54_016166 [Friedmanniomyces endolithicus]
MGKAGRIACITIPWALALASLVCLILIEISGWSPSGSPAGNFYFLRADFSNFTTASASTLANTTTLTAALENAKATNQLRVDYDVHLWNYCTSDRIDGTINTCTPKQAQFYFDPVAVWGLNSTNTTSSPAVAAPYNPIGGAVNSGINTVQSDAETYENELLGKSGKEALDAYRHVAKWMFIAYEISFWTTLATLICSVLAVFSRWGSFLTWIFSIASSLITLAAVLTSTLLFAALTAALETLLKPYSIRISLGLPALTLTWLAVLFSWAATLFWLASVCCCSGRSNPHHRSNKGGLWAAEPKGQGYSGGGRGNGAGAGRGRGGMRVEKTGGGYERVASPFLGHEEEERVPLQDYPPQQPHGGQPSGPFEPYRQS